MIMDETVFSALICSVSYIYDVNANVRMFLSMGWKVLQLHQH